MFCWLAQYCNTSFASDDEVNSACLDSTYWTAVIVANYQFPKGTLQNQGLSMLVRLKKRLSADEMAATINQTAFNAATMAFAADYDIWYIVATQMDTWVKQGIVNGVDRLMSTYYFLILACVELMMVDLHHLQETCLQQTVTQTRFRTKLPIQMGLKVSECLSLIAH
jgi:hypothetical protein